MITENPTRKPEPFACTEPAVRQTTDPIGLLLRVYRQAGLPMEDARRCALADFQCNFPQYLPDL